jgi:predicted permease
VKPQRLLGQFWRDIRFGLRQLLHQPGFAATASLTLAIGIGANSAVFSLLYNAVLRPLPYPSADRLMRIELLSATDQRGVRAISFSYPKFVELARDNRTFDSMAAYARQGFTISATGYADRVIGEVVSAAYFTVLGVSPAIGAGFTGDEDRAIGASPVVVISDALWRSRLGGRSDVIGAVVRLNGVTLTITGVMPSWFRGESDQADVWLPMTMAPAVLHDASILAARQRHWHQVVGRLRPGVTPQAADADVSRAVANMPDDRSSRNPTRGTALPLSESKRDPRLRTMLQILLGAVGMVMLIACLNLANVLLARGVRRQREFGVRLSLGADRASIVRQMLAESLVVSVLGAALSLLVAAWMLRGLAALRPAPDASLWPTYMRELTPETFGTGAPVALFSFGAALAATLLIGMLPALTAAGSDVLTTLKADAEGWSARRWSGRIWQGLIVVQVSLVVVLLTAAVLVIRSFDRFVSRPTGVAPANILTFRVSLPSPEYSGTATRDFFDRLRAQLAALPDVASVARARHLPIRERGTVTAIRTDTASDTYYAGYNAVDAEFFGVFGVEIVSGRLFDKRERDVDPPTAVIDQSAARQLFGAENPLGRRVTAMGTTAEVVGVIRDVRYEAQRQQLPIAGDIYVNLRQSEPGAAYIALRTAAEPARQIPEVRRLLASLDPGLPLLDLKTMDEYLAGVNSYARFTTLLLSLFALLALLLAVVGIYGTLSHAVEARRREIGIRMAVGADRQQVLAMILAEGMATCAIGIGAGAGLALAATRVMRALLFEISPTDPLSLAAAIVVLAATAILACWVPAHRAATVSPIVALRR